MQWLFFLTKVEVPCSDETCVCFTVLLQMKLCIPEQEPPGKNLLDVKNEDRPAASQACHRDMQPFRV